MSCPLVPCSRPCDKYNNSNRGNDGTSPTLSPIGRHLQSFLSCGLILGLARLKTIFLLGPRGLIEFKRELNALARLHRSVFLCIPMGTNLLRHVYAIPSPWMSSPINIEIAVGQLLKSNQLFLYEYVRTNANLTVYVEEIYRRFAWAFGTEAEIDSETFTIGEEERQRARNYNRPDRSCSPIHLALGTQPLPN